MNPTSLEVLIVEGEEPITAALATALCKRGHHVETAPCVERALELPVPDVLVCEAALSGACGLDLLAAMHERGDRARAVLLFGRPTVEDCQRALELGAAALLTKPFRLADLIRAVEDERPRADRSARDERVFEDSYSATPDSVERCGRDLAAFAIRHGVRPTARARICSAAAEIVDNAQRHAGLRPPESIHVRAHFEGPTIHVRIRDRGIGFDHRSILAQLEPGPATGGLSRASALSEAVRIETSRGNGTLVVLRFCTSSAAFPAGGIDLSEVDFLSPREAKVVLGALLDGQSPDVEGVSPALAVVLGRCLAGPDPTTFETASPSVR